MGISIILRAKICQIIGNGTRTEMMSVGTWESCVDHFCRCPAGGWHLQLYQESESDHLLSLNLYPVVVIIIIIIVPVNANFLMTWRPNLSPISCSNDPITQRNIRS